MNLTREQSIYFERAKREGFLLLYDYDPETHLDLELEWRTWCQENCAPFVKVEVSERGATVSYSLLRFSTVTDLTEAEIDELVSFTFHAHGSEMPECFPECGQIGLIELADAQHIAVRMVEFCCAGIQHWKNGATVSRIQPAQREKTA
jgi:hypothetical protein